MAKTIKAKIDKVEISDILHDLGDVLNGFTFIRYGISDERTNVVDVSSIDSALFFLEKSLFEIYLKLDKEIHEEE